MRHAYLATLMIVGAVLGTDARAQDPGKAQPEAPAKEKKICRSLMPTGSMMATRVCNTREGWKTFDAYNADGADQFHNVTRMTSPGVRR